MLTSDLDSILMNRLRTKEGLIYHIGSEMVLNKNDKNLSYIYLETNVSGKNLLKTIEIIIEELRNLKTNYVDDKFIQKYKSQVNMNYLENSITLKPINVLNEYAMYELWNQPIIKFKQEFKNFGDVDKQKVKKFLLKCLQKIIYIYTIHQMKI